MSAAQFRQVIDVDLNAPFIVAKAIIPDLKATEKAITEALEEKDREEFSRLKVIKAQKEKAAQAADDRPA